MWEWRIFYQDELSLNLENFVKSSIQFHIRPIKRYDCYYFLDNPEIGLKERGPSNSSKFYPIIEIKVRLERLDNGMEYWLKPVKYPINQEINPDVGVERIKLIEILKDELREEANKFAPYYKIAINILKSGVTKRIEVHKIRKKITAQLKNYGSFDVESTQLMIDSESWNTISFETSNSDKLSGLVANFKVESKNLTIGYPEFIQKFI